MRKHRRGYTLFETILVVVILAVAAAVVAPSVRSMYGDAPLTASADMVKARWADARARAMAESRPYRFAIMDTTGRFRIAPDGPEFWEGGQGGMQASTNGTRPPLVLEDVLPQDVRFCTLQTATGQAQENTGSEWVCPIVFMPDGTARADAEIAFAESGGRPLILRLQSATGAVTTSR
ncbi:MAG: prepilin-type N-terminal cleavage/methylation domain-containing protein [Gemmataceae bacterium]|nr:prepilin-type N-terminal cleavage/methylation domain-containing protein [Gemmataceae bacterium]